MHAVYGSGYNYDVSPDGQRFLLNTVPPQLAPAVITAVIGWDTSLHE
jgi:hypothetical protein